NAATGGSHPAGSPRRHPISRACLHYQGANMRRSVILSLILVLGLVGIFPAADSSSSEFFFKPGDRIVFLGDSITEQYQYSSTIELYLTTRFPKGNMSFINAGIGGDTAGGGARRFLNPRLAHKPTTLPTRFGMKHR